MYEPRKPLATSTLNKTLSQAQKLSGSVVPSNRAAIVNSSMQVYDTEQRHLQEILEISNDTHPNGESWYYVKIVSYDPSAQTWSPVGEEFSLDGTQGNLSAGVEDRVAGWWHHSISAFVPIHGRVASS